MTTPYSSGAQSPWEPAQLPAGNTPEWYQPGGPPPRPKPVRPIGPLGRAVTTLLGLGLVVEVVAVFSAGPRIALLNRLIADPQSVPESETAASDAVYGGIGLLQVAVFVATAVVFLVWLVRAYRNVEARGGHLRHSRGWVIGSWFVPILSLVRPKQIVDDVWRGSAPSPDQTARIPAFVHLWWALFLVSALADQAAFRFDQSTLEALRSSAETARVADILRVVLSALAIALVWLLTQRQRSWTGETGYAGTPAGPYGGSQYAATPYGQDI